LQLKTFRRAATALLLLAAPALVQAEPTPVRGRPAPAWVLAGQQQAYRPPLSLELAGTRLLVPLSVATRLEGAGGVPVDAQGSRLTTGAATNLQARVGLSFNTRRALIPFNFGAEYEHDVLTGPASGGPELAGAGLPGAGDLEHQLRKASGRVSLGYYVHLIGGLTTSHWGLGLLANDGAHGWEPGSARFSDPRGGDRTARLALASGPVTHLRIFAAFSHDWIQDDDTTLDGDRARQYLGALTIGRDLPTTLGFYAARRQLNNTRNGATLDIWALDLYGKTSQALWGGAARLTVEAEAALIIGETTLSSTVERPTQDVLQLGAALRARLELGRWAAVLDLLYASGDANFDDGQQNAFKTDPNYELGLLMHRHVLAGMTGRAVSTASDPTLTGYPTRGIERFPTRGAHSNTVVIFPRALWRPLAGLEIYGGPLFAFCATALADPFNTKRAGGAPRNALNGAPGRFMGAELDAGVRLRALLGGTELTSGLEAGVLFPGAALARADGAIPDPVVGGRLTVDFRF
jgi:hypothetical protein